MESRREGTRPSWLKIRLRTDDEFRRVRSMIGELRLNTVCTEARCPNIYECWNRGTATFMILGDTCTRSCGFCGVKSGRPSPGVDPEEPAHVAEAVDRLRLRHAVITSVDRDDLEDGGAGHFRDVTLAIRSRRPSCSVEVLTPDFKGKAGALDRIVEAGPAVFAHNVETVPRLYRTARRGSSYEGSLELLRAAAARRDAAGSSMRVKSSLMVGLGERDEEIVEVLSDLRGAGVDLVTLGQYLKPTRNHLPVERLVDPAAFASLRRLGMEMGFEHVESGPLVRSSYRAESYGPGMRRPD
jgi:lipoyl synthase